MNDVHFHKLSMLMYFMFVLCISVIVLFTFRITTLRTNQIDAQIKSEIAKQPELIETPAPSPSPDPYTVEVPVAEDETYEVLKPPATYGSPSITRKTFREFLELNPQLAIPKDMRE